MNFVMNEVWQYWWKIVFLFLGYICVEGQKLLRLQAMDLMPRAIHAVYLCLAYGGAMHLTYRYISRNILFLALETFLLKHVPGTC